MSTQVKSCELHVANSQLLRCYPTVRYPHVPCLTAAAISLEELTGMKGRLEDSDSVILREIFALVAVVLSEHASSSSSPQPRLHSSDRYQPQHTFNICNSVVFPALSRPRNRSFACLFISPRAERVSQTVGRSVSVVVQDGLPWQGFLGDKAATYTS